MTINLQERLQMNNGLPLNDNFSSWEQYIQKNIISRNPLEGIYKFGKDKDLLEVCKKHADKYNKPLTKDNLVVLTHPFYLSLSQMNYVESDSLLGEVNEYLQNLGKLLEQHTKKDNFGLAVFETLHHYTSLTSSLLEEGLIDKVIFTEYDNGCPISTPDLREISKKRLFFGGGYNRRCLSTSISSARSFVPEKNVWAINDLVLNSPLDGRKSLKVKKVMGVHQSSNIVLDQFLERLDKGEFLEVKSFYFF